MEKKISIIIPCYNVQAQIDRCVNSLVRQTIGVEAMELIFVDDASEDGTLKRLAQWEKRFPESIMVIACEENGRQGTARNIGIQYASAPYIGYVDADDWIESQMYQSLYEKAVKSGAQVTACLMGRDYGDGNLCDVKKYNGRKEELIIIASEKQRHEFLKTGIPGGVVTRLYRHDFLEEKQIRFPEHLAYEDNYFGALVSYAVESVYVVDKVFYHYYYNPESTVSARNSMHQLDRLEIELIKLDELRRRGYEKEFREEIYGSFLKLYYINSLHLIFTRFDELPYEILETMRETVLEKFPDYKDSLTYQRLSSMEKGFLLSLETEMTQEKWRNLASNYRYLIQNKEKYR